MITRTFELPSSLDERLRVTAFRRSMKKSEIIRQALQAWLNDPKNRAAAPYQSGTFERLAAPRGLPDDLVRIQGIGPQIVHRLNNYGIFHLWQIAGMSPAEAEYVDADVCLGGRIQRDDWIGQAQRLLDENLLDG